MPKQPRKAKRSAAPQKRARQKPERRPVAKSPNRIEKSAAKQPSKNGKPPTVKATLQPEAPKAEQKELMPELLAYRIRVGKEPSGKTQLIGYTCGKDERRTYPGPWYGPVVEIDVARPFHFDVPSSGSGPSGFIFEGMTGENAKPWTAAEVLAGARYGMFGFSVVE